MKFVNILVKLSLIFTILSIITGLKIFPYPDTCTYHHKISNLSYLQPFGVKYDPNSGEGGFLCGMMVTSDIFIGHFLITDITIILWVVSGLSYIWYRNSK